MLGLPKSQHLSINMAFYHATNATAAHMFLRVNRQILLMATLLLLLLWSQTQTAQGASTSNEQYLDTIGCSSGRHILLSELPNNTLTLKLSRWSDYHLASSFINFHCKFKVIAPRGQSLMAIVQGLNLRRKSAMSETCRDYILMEQSDGIDTGSICGEVDVHDLSDTPTGLLGPRFFYEPKGAIEVTFSIDASAGDDSRKPISLQLVFTSYSECTSTSLLVTQRVRQCSNSRPHSCIPQNLFCDGIVNCGYRGSDFGADEKDCSIIVPPNKKFDESHIINSDVVAPENSLSSNKHIPHGFVPGRHPTISTTTSTTATASNTHNNNNHHNMNGGGGGGQRKSAATDIDNARFGTTSHRENTSQNIPSNDDGVPLPIAVALISAICGAMLVLVVLFFCCCIGRKLDRRNQQQPQHINNLAELGLRNHSSPQNGLELSVTHTSGHIRRDSEEMVLREVSANLMPLSVKLANDMPPPYDAIFPKPPTAPIAQDTKK